MILCALAFFFGFGLGYLIAQKDCDFHIEKLKTHHAFEVQSLRHKLKLMEQGKAPRPFLG
jgi:hypothetical protein